MEKLISYSHENDPEKRKRVTNVLALSSLGLILLSIYTVVNRGYYAPEVYLATGGNCFAWVAYFLWVAEVQPDAQVERFLAIIGLLATGLGTLFVGGAEYVPGERLPIYMITVGALVFLIYSTVLGFVTSYYGDRTQAEVIDALIPPRGKRLK